MDGRRILIFLETKKGCDAVTRQLRMDGWPALSIHGDKSQQERDWVLAEFKAGKHPIMIATDVAARGLGKYGQRMRGAGWQAGSFCGQQMRACMHAGCGGRLACVLACVAAAATAATDRVSGQQQQQQQSRRRQQWSGRPACRQQGQGQVCALISRASRQRW
jgi:hypothetical protein